MQAAYGDEKIILEVIRLCSTISKWIKAGGFRQKIKLRAFEFFVPKSRTEINLTLFYIYSKGSKAYDAIVLFV